MIGGPLAVRLSDGVRDQHVTARCPRLSFTKTAPGGHQSAQLRLNLPRDDWPDLGDADRIWLYDKRNGKTVWEGYTNNPGTSDQRDAGQGFDLTAYGGMSLASDDRRALVYIDRSSENWRANGNNPGGANAGWQIRPGASDGGPFAQFPAGQPIGTGARIAMNYPFGGTDMEFGHAPIGIISGKSDSGYQTQFHHYAGSWGSFSFGGNMSTTLQTSTPIAGDSGWTAAGLPATGVTEFALAVERTGGATTIADNTTWTAWPYANLAVCGRLLDTAGARIVGNGLAYVLASQVVTDLVGRMLLPVVDAAASVIATTAAHIDQLTYRQAVAARTVFDDLTRWEPDYLWEILHTTSTGKHVFNYRLWPTTARYEISTKDGYSKPGTDSGLCNRLVVNYTDDDTGAAKTYTATVTVAELGSRIRHADSITLPEGRGSAADAAIIGAAVLDDINAVSSSAKATVVRPIVDLLTGGLVQPWEIEPGYLARVRDTGDLLPIGEVTYDWTDDGTSAASLSLGRPRLTVEQRVARLDRVA